MSRGRPPEIGVVRADYLRVRVAGDEMEALDQARFSGESRSDFVRTAVSAEVSRRSAGSAK